jgi:hypothetical protein
MVLARVNGVLELVMEWEFKPVQIVQSCATKECGQMTNLRARFDCWALFFLFLLVAYLGCVQGSIFYFTRDRYVGSFSAGCMHGAGTYFYANGLKIEGEWKNGVRQRKITLGGQTNNGNWELEVIGSKERGELGDVKVRDLFFLRKRKF